jgi:hypothetical protein
MGGVFYLIGIALAGFAGYRNLPWYFILFSSLTMAVGYYIIRAPQIQGVVSRDGVSSIPKLLSIQIVLYSIITAPIYFIASIFS